MTKPTIYDVLKEALGREPTHRELVNEIKRILRETMRHSKVTPLTKFVAFLKK